MELSLSLLVWFALCKSVMGFVVVAFLLMERVNFLREKKKCSPLKCILSLMKLESFYTLITDKNTVKLMYCNYTDKNTSVPFKMQNRTV